MAKQAAAQVALELAPNEFGEVPAGVALCGLGEERGQVLANDAVQQRPLRLAVLVAKSCGTDWSDHWATFILAVERVDGADVTQPIAFYLHPTFREVMVRVVPENGKATLKLHAWGSFTVGAVVGDSGTLLELDLEAEPQFSEIFRSR